jgi:energy-coupling factor transporter transmembrane protein EcfT
MFLFPNAYIDLATIGCVSSLTGGQIFRYSYFKVRFVWNIIKPIIIIFWFLYFKFKKEIHWEFAKMCFNNVFNDFKNRNLQTRNQYVLHDYWIVPRKVPIFNFENLCEPCLTIVFVVVLGTDTWRTVPRRLEENNRMQHGFWFCYETAL